MKKALLSVIFLALPSLLASHEVSHSAHATLPAALTLLARTETGSSLISEAQDKFHLVEPAEILNFITLGQVSKTSSLITRQLDAKSGKETYSKEVSVTLKNQLNLTDLTFDLAHELTHAVEKEGVNPYDPDLSAARFIRTSIEGKGGEVEATLNECKVVQELTQVLKESQTRCNVYKNEKGRVDSETLKAHFYRVGEAMLSLKKILRTEGESLKELSPLPPVIHSSTGKAPYPLALYTEYQDLTRAACSNSYRRLASLEKHSENDSLAPLIEKTQTLLGRRCSKPN